MERALLKGHPRSEPRVALSAPRASNDAHRLNGPPKELPVNKLSIPSKKNDLRLSKETLRNLRVASGVRTGFGNGSKATSGCTGSIIDGNCTNMIG